VKRYQDINRETIDRWIEEGWEWGTPISHEQFLQAKEGKWDVLLTPTIPVPHEWIGDLMGKKVLGLASGGGQQMPIFTALGAECTVLDYSPRQIQSERLVAQREGFTIEAVQGDMTERLPFDDESFDLIFHPVSNCYIKEVQHVFQEAYRVLKPGGILLSGLGNEVNYLVDEKEEKIIWKMPFDPTEDEKAKEYLEKTDCGMQFSHTLEEQIGGQLKAGFTLVDLYEDTNGEGRLHDMNIKTYIATKAVKR
jgi:ubiquinone/menaquinone biosynthesis C-methylase UbiE